MAMRVLVGLLFFRLMTGPASAQTRVPDEGMVTLGVEAGIAVFRDDFDPAATVGVLFDYYLAPRFGLRTGFGWTEPGLNNSDVSLRHLRLSIDGLYNWERGKWHPFAGAGFGAYFLQPRLNGRGVGGSETEPGLNLVGGVEYFWGLMTTLKIEASYHVVNQGNLPWSPSMFLVTAGIKQYFD